MIRLNVVVSELVSRRGTSTVTVVFTPEASATIPKAERLMEGGLPLGRMEVGVDNPELLQVLQLGKSFRVDIHAGEARVYDPNHPYAGAKGEGGAYDPNLPYTSSVPGAPLTPAQQQAERDQSARGEVGRFATGDVKAAIVNETPAPQRRA